jgi:hypothetical protein
MAHFAKVTNGIVETVIVINNEVLLDANGQEQETIGAQFCADLFGGQWIQTSYSANFRGKHAGVGDLYDQELDIFKTPEEDAPIE